MEFSNGPFEMELWKRLYSTSSVASHRVTSKQVFTEHYSVLCGLFNLIDIKMVFGMFGVRTIRTVSNRQTVCCLSIFEVVAAHCSQQ